MSGAARIPPLAHESKSDLVSVVETANSCSSIEKFSEGGPNRTLMTDLEKEQTTPDQSISGTDPNDVWLNDARNPMSWNIRKRWTIVCLMAIVNFISSMASSAFEPSLSAIMLSLGSSQPFLSSFTISIPMLGYCIGPLIIAPVSELQGRALVLQVAVPILLISLIGSGFSVNIGMFIAFRAISGFSMVALVLIGGGVVADILPVERRGLGLSVVLAGPSIGPTLGPITGGYIAEYMSWRWIFWIYTIVFGVFSILALILYRETYAPVLLARWAKQQPSTANQQFSLPTPKERSQTLRNAWIRPFKMLFRSPIIIIVTFLSSVANGYLIFLVATLGVVFQEHYAFTVPQSGLAYLGMAIGFTISQATVGTFSDRHLRKVKAKYGAAMKPEQRLPLLLVGAGLLPVGLLLYGWTIEYDVHWIVPVIASGLVSIGVMYVHMPTQMYLVDSFPVFAVSATGASTIVRSVFAATLPLASDPLHKRLGMGWGNTLLAMVALTTVPISLLLIKFGERIRAHPSFQPKL